MFRDLRLAETEAMNHVADGARPIAQQLDDLKAVGLGQGPESCFHHGESEYASTRIFLSRNILPSSPERRNSGLDVLSWECSERGMCRHKLIMLAR